MGVRDRDHYSDNTDFRELVDGFALRSAFHSCAFAGWGAGRWGPTCPCPGGVRLEQTLERRSLPASLVLSPQWELWSAFCFRGEAVL